MPIPEDRLYKPVRLNRWFAVASVAMTASLFWMIWIDYDRPWKAFQDGYFTDKAALAHLAYLDATREERRQEIREARERVDNARELNRTKAGRINELNDELVQAGLKFNVIGGQWSRKKQLLDVVRDTYEKMLNRYGPDHPKTREAHKRLTDGEDEVEDLRRHKEMWEDKQASIQAELDKLNAIVRKAEKHLADLESVASDALKKDQSFRGVLTDKGLLASVPVVRDIINAPILDFMAPKLTPGRYDVKQLVLPNVRQRLNYLESYTTDRCTTCHIAIDDPAFAKDNLARTLERAIPAINEARQRKGQAPYDLPTPPILHGQDKPLQAGRVTDEWERLSKDQQNEYFDAMLALVNRYFKATGRKTIDLGQPLLAHPDLDLYLSVTSAHPIAKMGCTVCHEGNPQDTDFVNAAHSPPTHEARERWAEEYYITRFGVPNTTFETVEHYWDRSMLLPKYTEAGCAKCHSQISDIAVANGKRKGSTINLGRYLFTSVGCVNCHEDKAISGARRVGPDLRHVASKLPLSFIEPWVFFPQKFRPSTRMPHFFLQENNRAESATSLDPDPVKRTETEVAAIAHYLTTVSDPWEPIAKPENVKGDVERGRKLFKVAGCLACHGNIAEFGEAWITKDIAHREGIDEQTANHRYLGMTHEQRVHYAMAHFTSEIDTVFDPDADRFDPDRDYNRPTFTRFAPELSGIGSKVSFEWLYSWLIQPTHYAPNTKMPNLRLSPGEAADIAAYLMTLKTDEFEQRPFDLNTSRRRMVDTLMFTLLSAQRSERRSRAVMKDEGGELRNMLVELLASSLGRERAEKLIAPMGIEDKKLMYLGNKMIAHYGCYTCHEIRGFETTTPVGTELSAWGEKPVAQLDFAFYDHAFHDMRHEKAEIFDYVYPRDAEELNRWSPLQDDAHEQISQTHAGFAKYKLLNPRIWDREKLKKPYDKLKMGNFYFTEREAEALTTYLLSRVPPRVTDELKVDYKTGGLGPIAKGRHLTRELNCIGCHQIEDNAPTIQQYFRRTLSGKLEFDNINAPPVLWGEGAKLQHNWFHKFLQQVQPLRPWLQVRMPSFTLTGDDATTLVHYFAALSRHDAARLTKARGPVQEYLDQAVKAGGDSKSSDGAPGANWYEQESLKRQTAVLERFAVERKLIRARELDSLTVGPDELREAHADLLTKIDFMRKLYNVDYPFVEPSRPMMPRSDFDRGGRFFHDMGCLQCHVLGAMLPGPAKTTDDFVQTYRLDGVRGEGDDARAIINGTVYSIGAVIDGHTLTGAENIVSQFGDVETKAYFEGPGPDGEAEKIMLQAASAPNLSLTYQRLRREWVYNWLAQPQWIQPGTKMPSNFPDGVSPFEGDENYPGTGVDHMNLLVDYLFQAGETATRADLPKLVVTDEEEGFDENSGGDEDFDDD